MKYLVNSLATFSFWRYAVFSTEALTQLLASVGAIYLFMELLDFLSIYERAKYSKFAIVPIILVSLLIVIVSRRPVRKVRYRVPRRDYSFEVIIGDLFELSADLVISTSTTFDTDIASGLISPESLQGQLALRLFQGNTAEIDRQLNLSLHGQQHVNRPSAPGKKAEYPMGTVAKVSIPGTNYYFVAMSRLNEHGMASSTPRDVEEALEGLWRFIGTQGELRTLAIPLMGTGRGRLDVPRKKMIERIAQSFADAAKEKLFSNKLIVSVRPQDAENFGVNLFEVRDYLSRSLHV